MTACTSIDKNPFIQEWTTPYGIPPFSEVKTSHYLPAFKEGIHRQNEEVKAIVSNSEDPDFFNTIEALDRSGSLLRKVSNVFFTLVQNETNEKMNKLASKFSPMLSEHSDNMYLNETLFKRVNAVYEKRESLTLNAEQQRLLNKTYRSFVRSGALLNKAGKQRLREINKELSILELNFGDNVLAETNAYQLVLTTNDELAGLPEDVVTAANEAGKEAGMEGKWVFTLHKPSLIPFLQFSERRDLREKLFLAYINRGDNDNGNDNKKNIEQLVNLRLERANLLGFENHAAFQLDENMANTEEIVRAFLTKIWDKGLSCAKSEITDMQQLIAAEGDTFKLKPWDWWYYAERIRKARYDLDESAIKPYFQLSAVRQGAFDVANKLYGISFEPLEGMPVYHPDVEVFKVVDKDGSYLGIFMTDYYPRPGKRAGAWMGNFSEQYIMDGNDIRPVVYNVGNFSKPTANAPSLLNQDEVETLFHEFGHALHGLLTRCQYIGMSGTNVSHDFVELPSQIMENWCMHPDVLRMYAKHYKTGEVIPDNLIENISKSATFNQGFMTTELVAAALLDMDWHTLESPLSTDVRSFEQASMKAIGLVEEIVPRYRSTFYNHIFSGGYDAGYYAYLWAEVLDSDAFDLFEKKGLYDQSTAAAFRSLILEKGDSEDPMVLYKQFRGAEPDPEALIRRRGL